MKKAATLLLIVLLIAPLFVAVASPDAAEGIDSMQDIEPTISFKESMMASRNIRVAIYDESNTTVPLKSDALGLTNNITEVAAILVGAGYQVTLITTDDILDYRLTTASFDVFIMVNNLPRESISKLVKDFWLGGGGLLTFHGALSYLYYESIIIPSWDVDVGDGMYWGYFSSDNQNVTARHSTMKDYNVGDVLTERNNLWATAWERVLIGTLGFEAEATKADDFTILMNNGNTADFITAFSMDNTHEGGRVVHLPGDGYSIPAAFESIITDSIHWLAPRPKAKILYDLSHDPWLTADPWDGGYEAFYFSPWRTGLVNRSYTVDKLHPSSEGNLTYPNLEPYDMLVVNQPMADYTQAEVQAVEQWVQDGGALFVVGDNAGVPDNYRLNELIEPFGIQFNHTLPTYVGVFSDYDMHPTTEGCASLSYIGSARLNISGAAYPIWRYTPGDIAVAATEYGHGRVLVIPDANSVVDAWIGDANNFHFAMNIVNWLTSYDAKTLVYVDTASHDPNTLLYRGPVAQALNDIGLKFLLTYSYTYFNLSLHSENWELVVYDNINYGTSIIFEEILDYVRAGGRMVFSTWTYSNALATELNNYIGFEYAGNYFSPQPPIHVWNPGAGIFNNPNPYGAGNISSNIDYSFGLECQNLTVFDNATALAGLDSTTSTTNASIVLGAGGRVIVNGMLLSMYMNDTDDSTYPDAVEIWENEIAFLMKPSIDAPADVEYIEGTTGNLIAWHPDSLIPFKYEVEMDGVPDGTEPWDGGPVSYGIDGLANGTYVFTITIFDRAGYTAVDEVTVTVLEIPPTTTEPPPMPPLDTTILIIIAAAAGVVIIIMLIVMRKRGAE
ncbi:MAG: DUF4350 domain-containing protein [Candidatus Thorarchaeota archaeon]